MSLKTLLEQSISLILLVLMTFSAFAGEIHDAAEAGDLTKVKILLKHDPELLNDTTGKDQTTPLLRALSGGQKETAQYLIESGADINIADKDDDNGLHYAALSGMNEIVNTLIEKGLDIDAMNSNGWTPLIRALVGKQYETARLLIEKGADPNIQTRWKRSAMVFSIAYNQPDIVQLLIEKGADVNLSGLDENTPLHGASSRGHLEIVKLLLKNGADPLYSNFAGKTPLVTAVEKGKKEIVEYMLNLKIDPNLKNSINDRTPMHYAAIKGHQEIAELLLNAGAKINAVDSNNKTPLFYSIKHEHKLAEFLVQHGANCISEYTQLSAENNLQRELNDGEALIWYLGHSGWAVKTGNNLLIFDYWEYEDRPVNPGLSNGNISIDEIKDLNVKVFASHAHGDHYDETILEWENEIDNIEYYFGWKQSDEVDYHHFEDSRETFERNDLKIRTIDCLDGGKGFMVEVDGLTIYHSGDYTGDYNNDMMYLAEKSPTVDLAFMETSDYYKHITKHSIQILEPKWMFPMHAKDNEYFFTKFADEVEVVFKNTKVQCADNRGDSWVFSRKD